MKREPAVALLVISNEPLNLFHGACVQKKVLTDRFSQRIVYITYFFYYNTLFCISHSEHTVHLKQQLWIIL